MSETFTLIRLDEDSQDRTFDSWEHLRVWLEENKPQSYTVTMEDRQ